LLAEGEPKVLLVVYDCPLPGLYATFQDCEEQPFACLADRAAGPAQHRVELVASPDPPANHDERLSGGLEVLRFFLRDDPF
jgi:hypothetical protein